MITANIIFHDTSIGNTIAVVFFCILISFLFIGLSMFSSSVRDKMEYSRKQDDYKYHRALFIILGIAGILCLDWKMNKIDTIVLESNTMTLKGYFGNEIAAFIPDENTNFEIIYRASTKSTGLGLYIIVIQNQGKQYYTNYLNDEDTFDLSKKLEKVMKEDRHG